MRNTALFFSLLSWFFLSLSFPSISHAQNLSAGTAITISMADKNIQDGNIIVSTPKGYARTAIAYDSNMFGVYTESPSVYLKNSNDPQGKPVISSGKAYVLVSSVNGNIKKNDLITTSTIRGAGQKSTRNGTVLGTALEDYTNSNQKATGKILVAINIHFDTSFASTKTNVLEVFRGATDPSNLTQLTSLRYIVAACVVLTAFTIGFAYFGKVSSKGIEALGRNPLASRTIQLNLVMNIILMITIILAGVGIGYLILIL